MIEKTDGQASKYRTWPQWIAGFGVLLLVTEMGCMGAWTSPYIALLTSSRSPFPVTLVEASWVASFLGPGRPFGAIGGSVCINYFGSKTAILVTCVPIAFSWVFTILADSVEWLYTARFFGGIAVGMIYSCFSLYIGEIADANNRGTLLALSVTGLPIGCLVMSIMGTYLNMQISATVTLILCFLTIALFIWLPESPHHLVKKNLDKKARSSIQWYHRECDVELELMKLRQFVEISFSKQSLSNTLKEMKSVQFRKSMFLGAVLISYGQMSGINTIVFFMESILTSAKVSVVAPGQMVIIVMALGIVGSSLSMYLMDRYGRKKSMIVSCIGLAVAFSLLTIEFHLLSFGYDPKILQSLPIVGISLFNIAMYVGALPVPPAMIGELFPPHLKCIAACCASCIAGVVSFIMTSTYIPLLNLMTERYLYLFYAILIATAVPFTMFCVPETKGMTLQEIQNRLTAKSTPRSVPTDKKDTSQEQNGTSQHV